ncbi:MAG: response regulator [Deltaproteobacteria bacterium]|nr:response regulator [Deltaproteobacteria bacterium]
MAKTVFPASRELFNLVREIAHKCDPNDRISDVDIGRIIGFESPRTSRWKHGQIAVVDAARLLSLSQGFDIDISILNHVAAGYLSSDEALAILAEEGKMVRFLGEQIVLPVNHQMLTVTGGEGTTCRVIRRTAGHYHRKTKRLKGAAQTNEEDDAVVLLADDDRSTIEAFTNLTGQDTGITGVVARSGSTALVAAGRLRPQIVIFDLFLGQTDGFTALRSIANDEATRDAEVFATSLSLTPDVVRNALGCGALEVIQRPLRSRVLSRLLGRLRTM